MVQPREDRWKAITGRAFGSIAQKWSERVPGDGEIDSLIELLGCSPGASILDAGCGAGADSVALARRGYRVRGFDISSEMIAQARDRAAQLGLDGDVVSFRVGDVEDIDAPDASFDAILCRCVLDFTPHPGVALCEFRRVLRPGGRLLLSTLGARAPAKLEWWRRFLPDNHDPHYANDILPWEMEALLGELGWRIEDQFPAFRSSIHGFANAYTEESAARLTDPVLRQTVCSSWTFVATCWGESTSAG
ncbi:MAG: class I SAM-dependent methyltransferase [Chloroflexi bacterium]|nr:class I SAM-dependent methyltransferase [Chloroflexota bacterium]